MLVDVMVWVIPPALSDVPDPSFVPHQCNARNVDERVESPSPACFTELVKGSYSPSVSPNPPLHCSQLELRTVERWIRRNRRRVTTLDKFCETGWRWTFYTFIHIAGIALMWDKAWVWDITQCWWDYPNHHIDKHIWWYYIVELTFYWSLFFSQFVDVKRKDFWEMFVHHVATIALMVLSWTCHLHRVGSLVLLVHDFADHWLELAKMTRYVQYQRVCDVAFSMFALTWVYTSAE